ncbi:hypothetical protein C9I89_05965 [Photobacterium lipolyticum]|uniref:DUF4222 domain-containing protein n=1 Tax=Photobacterium lipolyticum TaxID=266810 RepID=A0A2T3N1B0_9GAMM|nr:hypothetical protein C9I89_05965 [Photobacterium lipolyticum]
MKNKSPIKVGETYPTTNCGILTVIQYVNSKKIQVRFNNTGEERWTFSSCIRKGNVHAPSLPRVPVK